MISNSRAVLFLILAITLTGSFVAPSSLNKIAHAAATTPAVIVPADENNTTSSFGLVVTGPFYEANASKFVGQRVVSTANGIPQVEQSIVENGTMRGIGNVTDLETWTNTFTSPTIAHGVGQGVITTADGQIATWTGYGLGRSNINGVVTYHDLIIFNTNSTGKLAFLKNLEALSITVVDGSKQTRKMWEWK